MEGKRFDFLGRYKLRQQLLMLVAIAVVMMVILQMYYFMSFNRLILSDAQLYTENISSKTNNKVSEVANSIETTAEAMAYNLVIQNFLLHQGNNIEIDSINKTSNTLMSLVNLNKYVSAIFLIDKAGEIALSTDYENYGLYVFEELKAIYPPESINKPVFTSTFTVESKGRDRVFYSYLLPIYNVESDASIGHKIGTGIVLCDVSMLFDIAEDTDIGKGSLFYLLDSNKRIAVSNHEDMINQQFDSDMYKDSDNKNSMIYLEKDIESMGWKTVSIVSSYEITRGLYVIRRTALLLFIITLLLLVIMSWLFIRNITEPISTMVKSMHEIGEGKTKKRLKVTSQNEIGALAEDINIMLDKTDRMTSNMLSMQTKLLEMEISKKEAELMTLQSQINPHFLYNTLECIRSMGLMHEIDEVVDISVAMANIFRYSIKGEHATNVSEELKCIKDYLLIMSIRYMGNIVYEINVDEELMEKRIIKMILQPLVENSIRHGIEPVMGGGKVIVEGTTYKDRICFTIKDDGVGIEENELIALRTSMNKSVLDQRISGNVNRTIGLSNINSRIKLYYGDHYGLKIYSKKSEGTKVIVELPINIEDVEGDHHEH